MKTLLKCNLLIVASLFLTISCAFANPATDQSCKLLTTIIDKGVDSGKQQMVAMTSWMPEPTKSQFPALIDLIKDYQFVAGEVFLTGQLSSFFTEHLIVLDAENSANVYMRLYYEKITDKLQLSLFEIDSPFSGARDRGNFLQQPVPVKC